MPESTYNERKKYFLNPDAGAIQVPQSHKDESQIKCEDFTIFTSESSFNIVSTDKSNPESIQVDIPNGCKYVFLKKRKGTNLPYLILVRHAMYDYMMFLFNLGFIDLVEPDGFYINKKAQSLDDFFKPLNTNELENTETRLFKVGKSRFLFTADEDGVFIPHSYFIAQNEPNLQMLKTKLEGINNITPIPAKFLPSFDAVRAQTSEVDLIFDTKIVHINNFIVSFAKRDDEEFFTPLYYHRLPNADDLLVQEALEQANND